jgi:hypothetical protein
LVLCGIIKRREEFFKLSFGIFFEECLKVRKKFKKNF